MSGETRTGSARATIFWTFLPEKKLTIFVVTFHKNYVYIGIDGLQKGDEYWAWLIGRHRLGRRLEELRVLLELAGHAHVAEPVAQADHHPANDLRLNLE